MSLTYEGVGQNHKWARQETYSGRLVENATQAIARDILAEAMARMEGYGLNIVGHVHDEVIIEAPKDRYTVDEVCKLMSVNPEWCKDLPLNAAGYKGSYYFTIATSYRINEPGRTFKSEYVISQSIMMACKKQGYDGVAYYSKRVSDELFALCAINLALFVDYTGEYSKIVKHMKMDDAFNYGLYEHLNSTLTYRAYELRSTRTLYITNIGCFDRQYPYRETKFSKFDEFLFTTWRDNRTGKAKDQIPWGVPID